MHQPAYCRLDPCVQCDAYSEGWADGKARALFEVAVARAYHKEYCPCSTCNQLLGHIAGLEIGMGPSIDVPTDRRPAWLRELTGRLRGRERCRLPECRQFVDEDEIEDCADCSGLCPEHHNRHFAARHARPPAWGIVEPDESG